MCKPDCSLILAAVFLGVCSGPARPDDELQRASLRGLKSVYVRVESLNPEAERDGLTESQLQTDVELRLRLAGIKVVSKRTSAPGGAYLYFNVNTLTLPGVGRDGLYAFNVRVSLNQSVFLERDPSIVVYGATTWHTSGVGTVGKSQMAESLRKVVSDSVSEFINAYLSVNAKIGRITNR